MNVITLNTQFNRGGKSSTGVNWLKLSTWYTGHGKVISNTSNPHDAVEEFEFRPLNKIRSSLLKINLYSEEEVNELISSLADMPEYAGNRNNKKSPKKR